MAKSFPIPNRADRFLSHVSAGGISNPAPMIVRDGEGVVMGDEGAKPLVLSKPGVDCCCNDEILTCPVCSHLRNDLRDSAYFDCDRRRWLFDDLHTCKRPNAQTLCCRTFLPTPHAHVQLQTKVGDFYFPNTCFSMRISLDGPLIFVDEIIVKCCIGVVGILYSEVERRAVTMSIFIAAIARFRESFGRIPCTRIQDDGGYDALDGGYITETRITKWRNVKKIDTQHGMACADQGTFGNSCRISPGDATEIVSVSESGMDINLPFKPPYAFPWKIFYDSRNYLNSSFTTNFQIEPKATIGIGAEHDNAPC